MNRISPPCFTAIVLVLMNATTSLAASTLIISSSGGGSFVLQGTGIEKAAAFEITVAYDSSSLSNPRVTQGSLLPGAMMAVNSAAPGIVRIGMVTITPVSGSGPIATLSFDVPSGSSGKILSLSAKLANINGQLLPVTTQVAPPRKNRNPLPRSSKTRHKRHLLLQQAVPPGRSIPVSSRYNGNPCRSLPAPRKRLKSLNQEHHLTRKRNNRHRRMPTGRNS